MSFFLKIFKEGEEGFHEAAQQAARERKSASSPRRDQSRRVGSSTASDEATTASGFNDCSRGLQKATSAEVVRLLSLTG